MAARAICEPRDSVILVACRIKGCTRNGAVGTRPRLLGWCPPRKETKSEPVQRVRNRLRNRGQACVQFQRWSGGAASSSARAYSRRVIGLAGQRDVGDGNEPSLAAV